MTARERNSALTHDEHPKAKFRAVFVSLHGDAKRYPGGITALAHELGMIPAVLADKLSPNIFDKVVTARELLEVFERTRSVATANALALLIDRTTVPVGDAHASPREVVQAFMALTRRASEALANGAEALEDGRLDADERAELEPLVAGTLCEQLAHLQIELRLQAAANAVPGKGLTGTDRLVLAKLRDHGGELRPREIEDALDSGRATVNAALQKLEHKGLVARRSLPCPKRTKAFAWRALPV